MNADRAALSQAFAAARDERSRIALLLALAGELDAAELVECVEELFRGGDAREQAAIVRALPDLPHAQRWVRLARAAARTNVVPVFEALACDNPWPARHLPDDAFRQLVLKAVFLGVSLSRVAGLAERVDDELRRMADDYAAERRAAGRPISSDLASLLTEATSPTAPEEHA